MQRALLLVALLVPGLAWGPAAAAQAGTPGPAARPDQTQTPAAYLEEVLTFVEQRSVRRDRIDWTRLRREALAHARDAKTVAETYPAIRFVVGQLGDRHSRFYTPDEARLLVDQGRMVGFGFRAVYPEGTVVQVYPGSPADQAGVRVGDTVRRVNSRPPAPDARGSLVDLPGSVLWLTLARRGRGVPEEISLTASPVDVNSAPVGRRLPGGIGYLELPEHLGTGEIAKRGRYAELARPPSGRWMGSRCAAGWSTCAGTAAETCGPCLLASGPSWAKGKPGLSWSRAAGPSGRTKPDAPRTVAVPPRGLRTRTRRGFLSHPSPS